MRRVTSVALVVCGLFIAITGIWNFFPPFSESFSPGHAIGSVVFAVLCVVHVWLNWKAILKYFKSLGWWWLLVGTGLLATVLVVLIPLIHM